MAERTNKGPSYPNRWKVLIDSLVADRRKLRKDLLRATTDMEKGGYQALLKVLAEKLMKLRRAERRRLNQREKEAEDFLQEEFI